MYPLYKCNIRMPVLVSFPVYPFSYEAGKISTSTYHCLFRNFLFALCRGIFELGYQQISFLARIRIPLAGKLKYSSNPLAVMLNPYSNLLAGIRDPLVIPLQESGIYRNPLVQESGIYE